MGFFCTHRRVGETQGYPPDTDFLTLPWHSSAVKGVEMAQSYGHGMLCPYGKSTEPWAESG